MTPVSNEMHARIRAELDGIARDEDVSILLAVESGSRAWGFHSPDSDYDVRFIYARPVNWHLSLGKKRDVIERPIDAEMDISGWDLSKALGLAIGSNAVLPEWLQSPVTYVEAQDARADLTTFCGKALTRKPVTWHYLSLIRRQQEAWMVQPDGTVKLKRFFYCLRPALALRWMRLHDAAVPPMDMATLLDGVGLSTAQSGAVAELTAQKMALSERAQTGRPPGLLVELVADEQALAETWVQAAAKPDTTELWGEASALHAKYTRRAGP